MSTDIFFKVDGMGCQSCVSAVQKAVAGVDAHAKVSVDLPKAEVRIEHAQVPRDALAAAIEHAGYDILT
jgi:copper chaperone